MHRDWFDWASLIFSTLATSAGLVGLFVAIRAYKVAKRQTTITLEMEVLKELAASNRANFDSGKHKESEVYVYKPALTDFDLIALLPQNELPTWWAFQRRKTVEEAVGYLESNPMAVRMTQEFDLDVRAKKEYVDALVSSLMGAEVFRALRRRLGEKKDPDE